MRAPTFWIVREGRDSAPVLRLLLSPLGWLYGASVAYRMATTVPTKVAIPVISIGNISAGGTGKTPLAQLLRGLLADELGGLVAIVSRGYGGMLKGPVRVDTEVHRAQDVGDEPLMLAHDGPVFIAKDRAQAGQLAAQSGMAGLILDDAHQNPNLEKNLSLVVVDGNVGFGNGRLIPAGPLREPPARGLARTDGVIVMGALSEDARDDLSCYHGPVFHAELATGPIDFKGPVLGFCGIGRPEKFDISLREAGLDVVDLHPFGDHHVYRDHELKRLECLAKQAGAQLVTTAKDYVRLPIDFARKVRVLPVTVRLSDPEAFLAFLCAKLDTHSRRD
ncbi:tetraacyldisaccharide 4'-kinase [Candidatus Phycosocius spiralis]|uniref:Tetraacyldisaccharide 4'-kinase n=1 Tax=Candidatus Phycosocius spiralis TaxID=2815099 RepID=A0ABQ4PY48_9PROT|nr:tetraacyldisaccharide 4'-kinase [Candidatus Phycosocius spiralis]GIU67900.1 tetraacyldisaccharide 4'-kinase [Candidatus Phycosocius spiralis]